jgi:putative CocE/NonD family hydrolase
MNLEERSRLVNTPMLHLAGWFDIFSESQIRAFLESQFNGGPYARGNQKIIIGPWGHLIFPTNAIFSFTDLLNLMGRWYDYWLKGVNKGIMDGLPVKFYIIGINEWAYSDALEMVPSR